MLAQAEQQTIKVSKISEHIGAEVTGVDLSKPIDGRTLRQIYDALVDNVLLVVRNQHFSPEQFLSAASLFGAPMEQDNPQFAVPGLPLVRRISNFNTTKTGERANVDSRWHTDHTNRVYPPKFTTLYAVELPSAGGGTSLANMRAGYASLPDDLKHRINGMQTLNVIRGSAVKHQNNPAQVEAQNTLKPTPIVQPLVRTNPDNDTKSLYFHINKVENIVGMEPGESQDFLEDLLARALQPEFTYMHRWRLGDMLIWDNRSSLHKANYDYDPSESRVLYRMILRGERPS